MNESDLVFLQPWLGRSSLTDSINAYATASGVLVPFGEICRLLAFAIEVDAAKGKAQGFFLAERRPFSLDLEAGTAVVGDRTIPVAGMTVMCQAQDILVDARLLEAWFPLEVKVDLKAAMITFKSRQKLPLEEQWEREGRYASLSLNSGSNESSAVGEYVPMPYRAADIPFADVTSAWSQSQNGDGEQPELSVALAGDLLWMSSSIFLNRDSEGDTSGSRATLYREDPFGQLLGPMQARRVELGDLMQSPSLDLVGDLPSGRGVLVDNYSIGYRSKFATRSFRGRLPDGWTVELYQNNSLTGVQKSRSDGLYEFNDIPLRFGLNLFRFVFHGPMGERREETYRADIESDLPLPGTFQYRLAGVKPDDPEMEGDFMESSREIESAREQPTYMADGDYGLSRFFALNTGLARTHLEDGAHQYRVLGLRGLFSYLSFQTSLAQDLGPGSSKGRSIEGIVRSGFGYSSISLRRADYRDGFQQIHVPQDVIVDTPLRSETELDLFGTLNVKDHPVGLSFNHEVSEYEEGERTSTDELKATFNLANWSISPSLTRISRSEQQGPVPLDFAVFASSFGAMTAFQGGLDAQRKGGDFTLTGWQAALDITAVSGIVYRIGIRGSDSTLENATVLGSLNKLSGDVGYGVDAQYSQSDGYTLSLRVQASFAREPRTRRWTSSAQPMAGLGSISTVAFLDANGNQILDSKEEILEGAQFKVGGLPVESALKDPQVVFKPQLPRGQETPVQLIESSLEDPAMQPTVSGIRIVPRAGRVSCVEIPVARFGEIVGTTRIRREEGIQEYGGLELELMKASGEQVRIFRSSYDGFFEIRNLPLGNYVLRVAPQEVSRLKLKQPPVRTFTIDSEKNLFEGQDFIVEQVLSVPATSTLEVTP